MTDAGTPVWLTELTTALANKPALTSFVDEEAVVAIAVGKSVENLKILNGTIKPAGETEPTVSIPLTKKQLDEILNGSLSLSEAYMRGDVKPEGSTRALLLAIEIFDRAA